MKYVIPCRYARYEGSVYCEYKPGSEVELSEDEARKLRAVPVAPVPEDPLRVTVDGEERTFLRAMPFDEVYVETTPDGEPSPRFDSEQPEAPPLDSLARQQTVDVIAGLETVAEVEAALMSERERARPRQSVIQAGEQRLAELST